MEALFGDYQRKEGTMGLTINSSASAVSSLFSSMGGNTNSNLGALTNTIASITTDYASIKNGSYNKVVKAYYKKGDTEDTTVKKKTDKKTEEKVKSTALDKVATKATDLGSKASSLAKDSLYKADSYNAESVASKVSDFVKSYNDAYAAGVKSDSESIQNKALKMAQSAVTNEKALNKIGISVDSDNYTLSVDADKLKSASAADVEAVFGKKANFVNDITKQATNMANTANKESSATYTAKASYGSNTASVGSLFDNMF